jgi:diguanylate cyclase (GGDEF)-like protein
MNDAHDLDLWAFPGADTVRIDETDGAGELDGDPILVLIAHPDQTAIGTRFSVACCGSVDIGRSHDCELSFPDAVSVSRIHARIVSAADGVFIEDLDSTNGTFVNQSRVGDRTKLSSGDRVQLGDLHFKFLRAHDPEHAYHAALYQLALQDGLTEVANKRRFDDELQREFARAGRYGRTFSLILFDVDDFKSINDSHGHLCGDVVLQKIARLAAQMMRREATLARLGGDEFGILNPEVSADGAFILAEKLRLLIASEDFAPEVGHTRIAVTCSFGVAELDPDMATPDEVFHAADTALYRSKRDGANRTTTHV